MNLWSSFVSSLKNEKSDEFTSRLHQKIVALIPDKEDSHILIACLSGLMARIAYADITIHQDEEKIIRKSLADWTDLSDEQANAVASLCLDEVKDLAGIENHLYCLPLRESLSEARRYHIIESLFAVAAADGSVGNDEAEEIRNINTALLLEHKHFISARTTVLDKLGALKSR